MDNKNKNVGEEGSAGAPHDPQLLTESDYLPVGTGADFGATAEQVLRKVVDLEINEDMRKSEFETFTGDKFENLSALMPTRDIGHGNTEPIDEFKSSSDYEIALNLLNLNQKKFKKAAIIFYILSQMDVIQTRSRAGFLVKELKTSWQGTRSATDKGEKWADKR